MDNSVEVYQDGNSSAHESPQQSPVSDGVTVKAEDITGIAGVGGSTKLFVGQVPKAMMENELSSMFSPFGRVLDTSVLRDRLSGESKGCAFVTYATQHEADVAIASLHNMKILPGARNPLQVRYANPDPISASKPEDFKLFVGKIPPNATEETLQPIFEQYGHISEIVVLRGTDSVSKGCAFVKYSSHTECEAAITALNGKVKLEGAPTELIVKYADVKKEEKKQPPSAQNAILSALAAFSPAFVAPTQTGDIAQLAQFQASQLQAALMTFGQIPHAPTTLAQAIQSLSLLINVAQAGIYGLQQRIALVPPSPLMPPTYPGFVSAVSVNNARLPEDVGPEGANLFIYHLPKEVSDADLASIFAPYGAVVSAKVFVDKDTGLSKCFGFVSYDTAEAAQAAIQGMNGYQIGTKRLKVQLKHEHSKSTSRPY